MNSDLLNSQALRFSIVIPCHNADSYIGQTLTTIINRIPISSEVIVVENGSIDGSFLTAIAFADQLGTDQKSIKVVQSRKGLGNALRKGLEISRGEVVAFMADDLPFGVQEIETLSLCENQPARIFAISKYLPDSIYNSGRLRKLLGAAFKFMRSRLLSTPMSDTQGSFVGNGILLRRHIQNTSEIGFLVTTELFINLHRHNVEVIEIPCIQAKSNPRKSTIKVSAIIRMAFGLIRISRRKMESK